VQNRKERTQVNTGTPKSLRHSLRNGFTAYSALFLVCRLFSHHRLRGVSSRKADISNPQT
jgi:hypothetical protein